MEIHIKKQSFLFVLIIFINILVSCSNDIPKINRITSKEDLPTISIDIYEASLTENGLIKGKLKAKRLEQYEDQIEPNTKFPKGISIVFFDKEGTLESSLTADSAILYTKLETWEAIGNVVFTNISGQVLKTNHLYGDEKQQKIYTDEFVQITSSDGNIIKGASGFESNSSFTIYKFIDVSGRIAIEDKLESETDFVPQSSASDRRKTDDLKSKTKKHNIPKKPINKKKFKDAIKVK